MVDFVSCPSGPLSGVVRVPSDKSISHRALLMTSIAEGRSKLHHLLVAEDSRATISAMRAMGVNINQISDDCFEVDGVGLNGLHPPERALDLGNSGTAMRLLAGLLAAQPFESQLIGDSSLMRRPMQRIVDPLQQMGAHVTLSADGTPPLHIMPTASLSGICYKMPMASAQVKSCLLLAGLYANDPVTLIEPAPSRDHTERMLQRMGCSLVYEANTVTLQRGCRLRSQNLMIPADISAAAFFMVAASLIPDSDITLTQVGVNPTRIGVITLLKAMGADITLRPIGKWNGNEPVADIRVRAAPLSGIEIPMDAVSLAIDELPVIAIAAAAARGRTVLKGAAELRVKESDRIAAMAQGIQQLGVTVDSYEDGMIIEGGSLRGGQVDSLTDHRVAMSFAVAGAIASDKVTIRRCQNVATSFPNFVETANALGMQVDVF